MKTHCPTPGLWCGYRPHLTGGGGEEKLATVRDIFIMKPKRRRCHQRNIKGTQRAAAVDIWPVSRTTGVLILEISATLPCAGHMYKHKPAGAWLLELASFISVRVVPHSLFKI